MQQKEVLLRDPYEYIPAIAYLAVAVISVRPDAIILT